MSLSSFAKVPFVPDIWMGCLTGVPWSHTVTRINLVHPSELSQQHLFAEFREIKMVPKALQRSLRAAMQRHVKANGYTSDHDLQRIAQQTVLSRIPDEFTLGKGHVSFFYDKGFYLFSRYGLIRNELWRRRFNFDQNALLDPDYVFAGLDQRFNQNYIPTQGALDLIRARIAERISEKPDWYRFPNE